MKVEGPSSWASHKGKNFSNHKRNANRLIRQNTVTTCYKVTLIPVQMMHFCEFHEELMISKDRRDGSRL